MINVSPELLAALSADLTYLCRILTFARPDGTVLRFTDHDVDLLFEGETYISTKAFSASATNLTLNRLNNNVDIVCILDPNTIRYEELVMGLYDNAKVTLSIVSYKHLEYGAVELINGLIQNCQVTNRQSATLSVRGNVKRAQKQVCETYSAECRAQFGDARCKVDLAPHTYDFTVTTYVYRQQFFSEDLVGHSPEFFARGVVEWLTGPNKGIRIEVIGSNEGNIHLLLPIPMPMSPGDTGKIVRGCFKTLAACQGYNNVPNYRGEPYVPTEDGIEF